MPLKINRAVIQRWILRFGQVSCHFAQDHYKWPSRFWTCHSALELAMARPLYSVADLADVTSFAAMRREFTGAREAFLYDFDPESQPHYRIAEWVGPTPSCYQLFDDPAIAELLVYQTCALGQVTLFRKVNGDLIEQYELDFGFPIGFIQHAPDDDSSRQPIYKMTVFALDTEDGQKKRIYKVDL